MSVGSAVEVELLQESAIALGRLMTALVFAEAPLLLTSAVSAGEVGLRLVSVIALGRSMTALAPVVAARSR